MYIYVYEFNNAPESTLIKPPRTCSEYQYYMSILKIPSKSHLLLLRRIDIMKNVFRLQIQHSPDQD